MATRVNEVSGHSPSVPDDRISVVLKRIFLLQVVIFLLGLATLGLVSWAIYDLVQYGPDNVLVQATEEEVSKEPGSKEKSPSSKNSPAVEQHVGVAVLCVGLLIWTFFEGLKVRKWLFFLVGLMSLSGFVVFFRSAMMHGAQLTVQAIGTLYTVIILWLMRGALLREGGVLVEILSDSKMKAADAVALSARIAPESMQVFRRLPMVVQSAVARTLIGRYLFSQPKETTKMMIHFFGTDAEVVLSWLESGTGSFDRYRTFTMVQWRELFRDLGNVRPSAKAAIFQSKTSMMILRAVMARGPHTAAQIKDELRFHAA